jgi:ribonuclease D
MIDRPRPYAKSGIATARVEGVILSYLMSPDTPFALPGVNVRAISRAEMANLPIRQYEGEICVVATPQDLERALADTRQESVVGFDTETRPAFTKGRSYLPCLAQVATGRAVYLFQLRRADAFDALTELLQEPRTAKVGVALAHDLRTLKLVFPFIEENVVDLGVVARSGGISQTGVRNLAGMLLGIRIPKGLRTSNWATPQLSARPITYAATDAWICRELFLRFQSLGLVRA